MSLIMGTVVFGTVFASAYNPMGNLDVNEEITCNVCEAASMLSAPQDYLNFVSITTADYKTKVNVSFNIPNIPEGAKVYIDGKEATVQGDYIIRSI